MDDSVARIIQSLKEENYALSRRLAELERGSPKLRQSIGSYEHPSSNSSKQHARSRELTRVIDLKNNLAREFDEWRAEEQRDLDYGLILESHGRKMQLEMQQQIELLEYEDTKKAKIIDTLRQSLVEKEARINDLMKELDYMDAEQRLVNGQVNIANDETNPRLILASGEIIALKQDKALLLERFGALEEVTASKDSEIASLRLRLGESEDVANQERRQKDAEIRSLHEQIAKLEVNKADLELALSRAEIKRKSDLDESQMASDLKEKELVRFIEVERTRLADLQTDHNALTAALMEARVQIESLEAELAQKNDRVAELTEMALALDSDLSAKRLDPTIDCLHSKIRDLQNEIEARNLQLLDQAKLQAKVKQLRDENKAIQDNLNELGFHNRLLTKSCHDLHRHNSALTPTSNRDMSRLTLVQRLLIRSLRAHYDENAQTMEVPGVTGTHSLEIVPGGCNGLRERFLFRGEEVTVMISNGRIFAEIRRPGMSNDLVELISYLDSRASKAVRFGTDGKFPAPNPLSEAIVSRPAVSMSLPGPSAALLSRLPT